MGQVLSTGGAPAATLGQSNGDSDMLSLSDFSDPRAILTPEDTWATQFTYQAPASCLWDRQRLYVYFVGAGPGGFNKKRGLGALVSPDEGQSWRVLDEPVLSWDDVQSLPNAKGQGNEGVGPVAALRCSGEYLLFATVYIGNQENDRVHAPVHVFESNDGLSWSRRGQALAADVAPGQEMKFPVAAWQNEAGTWHLIYTANAPDVQKGSLFAASGPKPTQLTDTTTINARVTSGALRGDGLIPRGSHHSVAVGDSGIAIMQKGNDAYLFKADGDAITMQTASV